MSEVLLLASNPQKATLFDSVLCCAPHQQANFEEEEDMEEEEEDWSVGDEGHEDLDEVSDGADSSSAWDETPSIDVNEVPDDSLFGEFNPARANSAHSSSLHASSISTNVPHSSVSVSSISSAVSDRDRSITGGGNLVDLSSFDSNRAQQSAEENEEEDEEVSTEPARERVKCAQTQTDYTLANSRVSELLPVPVANSSMSQTVWPAPRIADAEVQTDAVEAVATCVASIQTAISTSNDNNKTTNTSQQNNDSDNDDPLDWSSDHHGDNYHHQYVENRATVESAGTEEHLVDDDELQQKEELAEVAEKNDEVTSNNLNEEEEDAGEREEENAEDEASEAGRANEEQETEWNATEVDEDGHSAVSGEWFECIYFYSVD